LVTNYKDEKLDNLKICHVTSIHSQFDDRIYLKECRSLSRAGYDVYLLSKDANLQKDGITFVQCVNPKSSRIIRILRSSSRFFKAAITLDCDVYHFHDPELLPCALKVKKRGKIVIFDSHEDVPSQILDKHWIPYPFRKLVSSIYKRYESYVVKRLDGIVAATPTIAKKFENRAESIVTINNYPIIGDINYHPRNFSELEAKVCYVGGLSEDRGLSVMIKAIQGIPVSLVLAGKYENVEELRSKLNVEYKGYLSRKKIDELYSGVIAGLLLFQPRHNHYHAQPIKMYEYMAAGLPIIASNFQYWKEIIEDNGCGICINPESVEELQQAIEYIDKNRGEAQEMGKRGFELVAKRFNWSVEEQKLIEFYGELFSPSFGARTR